MLRSLLGIKLRDKISNNLIMQETNNRNIAHKIKKLEMDYAGHIYRSDPKSWGKRALEWVPLNRKRKKGRPPIRWRDEIVESMRYFGEEQRKTGVYGNGWWRPMLRVGQSRVRYVPYPRIK